MSESQLYVFVAIALIVASIAMVTLAYCGYQALRSVRRMERRASAFMDRWTPVAEEAEGFLRRFAGESIELLERLNELTDRLHRQSRQVEESLGNLSSAAQRNADAVNEGLRRLLGRLNRAAAAIELGVRLPARHLRALGLGVSAAVRALAPAPRRLPPDRISADEEMFL